MLQFEELRLSLEAMRPEIDDLASALGLAQMKSEIQQLENRAAEPGFWDDMENSQKILQRTANLKAKVEKFEKLDARYEDAIALIEMGDEAEDESVIEEAKEELEGIRANLQIRLASGMSFKVKCLRTLGIPVTDDCAPADGASWR